MKYLNAPIVFSILFDAAGLMLFFASGMPLILFTLIHIMACILGIISLRKLIPLQIKNRMILTFFYFLLLFVMPLLGLIASIVIIAWHKKALKRYRPRRIKSMPIRLVQSPLNTKFAIGGLYYRLKPGDTAYQDKLNILHEAMNIAPQKINGLIRALLSDNNEEVRLLSFQLLNAQEKKLLPRIHDSLKKLKSENDPQKQFLLEKELAFEYWEYFYQGLAEISLANYITQKSLEYTLNALSKSPGDSALLYLAGRLSFLKKDYGSAKNYFVKYRENGGLQDRLALFFIEMAYNEKDFHSIKTWFDSDHKISSLYLGQAFSEFWNPEYAQ